MKPGVRRIVAPIVGIVLFAVFWELLVKFFDIRRFVLLPPSSIIDTPPPRTMRSGQSSAIT